MVWNSQGGVPRGTQLNGIYEIETLIAQGGMGEVYSGRAIQTGDRVAIKMILPEHANNQTIVDLFRREASTLHNIYHEAIVRYYVFSVDPDLGRPYLAMEFVDGPSLKDVMRDGPLGLGELDVLRRRLGSGLHAAHQLGVIHRDISPDNVILPGGSVDKAKIIDFGIAKSTDTGEGTLIGSGMAGKLNYVSPEQLGLFGSEVTGKSDIYSLGLVLAAAAIGQPIDMGGSQVEVVEKRRAVPDLSRVPVEIRPLISAMVQPDPADRPATMEEVATFDLTKMPGRGGGRKGGGGKKGGSGILVLFIILAVVGSITAALWYVGVLDKIIGGGDGTLTPTPTLVIPPTPDPNAPSPTPTSTRAPTPIVEPDTPPVAIPDSVIAANAIVGRSYKWVSAAFQHDRPDLLELDPEGALPPGLEFEDTGTGQAVLYGVPGAAGDFEVVIVARDPDDREGRLRVTVRIESAPVEVEPTLSPASPTPAATAVATVEPSPLPSPTPLPEPTARPTTGLFGNPTPTSGFVRPPTEVPEPPTATPLPPTDIPPSPTPLPPTATALPPTATPVPPTATAVPPTATPVPPPATPVLPTVTPVPPTATPVPPTSVPGNTPPTILDRIRGPAQMAVGDSVNIRIGSFSDAEDGTTLDIQLEGTLPPGLFLNRAAGAVVAIYGQPSAGGEYSFQVVAVDSGGGRATIPVQVSVSGPSLPATPTTAPIAQPTSPPTASPTDVPALLPTPTQVILPTAIPPDQAGSDVLRYLANYDRGDCFIAQPLAVTDRSARIAVYAGAQQTVIDFYNSLKAELSLAYDPDIVGAVLAPAQCRLARELNATGRATLGSDFRVVLLNEERRSGDIVSGHIANSNGTARLFLYISDGQVSELTSLLDAGTLFSFQFAGSGYQIVIAIRPRPGVTLPSGAGLFELIAEVNAGRAEMAMTYFNVQ